MINQEISTRPESGYGYCICRTRPKMEFHLSAPIRETKTSEVSETSEAFVAGELERDLRTSSSRSDTSGSVVSRVMRPVIRSVQ